MTDVPMKPCTIHPPDSNYAGSPDPITDQEAIVLLQRFIANRGSPTAGCTRSNAWVIDLFCQHYGFETEVVEPDGANRFFGVQVAEPFDDEAVEHLEGCVKSFVQGMIPRDN